MNPSSMREDRDGAPRWLWALALFAVLLHVGVNLITPFGVHRDELLYLSMGTHLRWWRMDFPPFIAGVANVSRAMFGDALWSIRLFPAITSGLIVFAAGVAAWRFAMATAATENAAARATVLTAVAVLTGSVFLRAGLLFQPVVFDQLWWTLALLAIAERQRTGNIRWWLGVGVALGLGLLTKHSIMFIGVGLVVGMLLTPVRRDLLTPWPWFALGIAVFIGLPSLVGQIQLDWPILWQMRDLQASQLEARNRLSFLFEQPLLVNPVAFVLGMAGLVWLLVARTARRWQIVGIACLVSWLVLIMQHGKAYYGAPVYPILFAAGAAALMQLAPRVQRIGTYAGVLLMVALAVLGAPLALPILSPAATAAYAARMGVSNSTETNTGEQLPLPQDFADMLGWPQQVEAVAGEWQKLTEDERARTVLVASNYGRAGALDLYGPRHGLPPVVSAAGSFWYFGPGTKPGDIMLALGGEVEEYQQLYEQCRTIFIVGTAWGVLEEQAVPIIRCDTPRKPLQDVWPLLDPANNS
ncbi:MAG TPA: glycosyltransferase family 39 protein [Gemmatimonas sp.]|uniref:ArnT family glycosyltransferase n=1 Tax=Gemmatimonas sp. TaxID=1962908 RepID=UPI002ED7B5D4